MPQRIDPIMFKNSGNTVIGRPINNSALPIVRNIATKSLAEFDPLFWTELAQCSLSTKSACVALYERIRRKCCGDLT